MLYLFNMSKKISQSEQTAGLHDNYKQRGRNTHLQNYTQNILQRIK